MDKLLADMLKRKKKEKGSTNTVLSVMAKTGMSKVVKYSTSINRNIAALKEQGKSSYMDIKAPQDILLMETVRFRMTGTVSYPCIKNRKYKSL